MDLTPLINFGAGFLAKHVSKKIGRVKVTVPNKLIPFANLAVTTTVIAAQTGDFWGSLLEAGKSVGMAMLAHKLVKEPVKAFSGRSI